MSRPKRLANRSYVGRAHYFLTFCTWDRLPRFKDPTVVADTLAHIQRTADDESFEVLAYCFMPDHLHLLVKGLEQTSDLKTFVKMSKQRSGYAHHRRGRERLWQGGYFERLLRDDGEAGRCAQYIANNPVRAGLVSSPADYEFLCVRAWRLEDLETGSSSDEVCRHSQRRV